MLLERIQKVIVSFGGKKVSVSANEEVLNRISTKLPADAASLLSTMVSQMENQVQPETRRGNVAVMEKEIPKNNIEKEKNTIVGKLTRNLPTEALNLLSNILKHHTINTTIHSTPVKADEENNENMRGGVDVKATNPGVTLESVMGTGDISDALADKQAFIRAQPQLLQRAINQKRALQLIKISTNPIEKLTIYEAGVALGLVVGSSTREDVINIMKDYSKIEYKMDSPDSIFFYSDATVNVFFNPSGIVTEVQFGNKFKGSTSKGLRVGDTITQAIECYGQPRMKAARGAIWNHFSVFLENNLITCIRIQS